MNKKGFLYVLANSSMPGLVKVGKTTRCPSDRAQELSGVTGLPTPFIVVFEQYFSNCDEAEIYVHAFLSKKGYRISENREFFSAPASEVVRAIIGTPGALAIGSADKPFFGGAENNPDSPDDFLHDDHEPDELEKLSLPEPERVYPWSDIWEEAQKIFYGGLGDEFFVDYEEALKLYKEAAKLGCLMAFRRIGDFYRDGRGVAKNNSKAVEFYTRGARKGNYFCFLSLSELFLNVGEFENSKKCLDLFFKTRKNGQNLLIENLGGIGIEIGEFLSLSKNGFFQENHFSEVIKKHKGYISKFCKEMKVHYQGSGGGRSFGMGDDFQSISDWVKDL